MRYDDRAATKIARVDLDGRLTAVAEGLSGGSLDRPYTGGEFSVAKDGTVAFTSGTPQSPSDVSVTRRGKTLRLTQLNAGLFADKTLAEVRPLAVTSSFDRRSIDAWMALPPNFDPAKKYPLILEIHGGPYAAYGPVFSTDVQLYAAAGYVVLYVNPRGSTSYGQEFANLIHHKYPSEDYDDLMSAVDAAIAQGHVDPKRLYVTGGSGGGVLTAWIVGRTDRFRAAVTQKPVINWASTVLTTDIYTYMPRYWFEKLPVGGPGVVLEGLALVAGGLGQDADPGAGRRPGFPHAGQRLGAVLPGAAAPGCADRPRKGAGRVARRSYRATLAIRGQGERDPRVVRALPRISIASSHLRCGRSPIRLSPAANTERHRRQAER